MFKQKNLLERTLQRSIDGYGKKPWKDECAKDRYIQQELTHIKSIIKVQKQLDQYQADAACMDADTNMAEICDSDKLGKHMRVSSKPKPDYRWDAHHIVSGGHTEAAALRGIFALLKLRIDDPSNGMWLPRRTQDTGNQPYPRAVPHSRIHRQNYYDWLNEKLLFIRTLDDMKINLEIIEDLLLTAEFPKKVMLVKGDKRASLAEFQEPYWDGTPWKQFRKL